jgi:hypothetical protein
VGNQAMDFVAQSIFAKTQIEIEVMGAVLAGGKRNL